MSKSNIRKITVETTKCNIDSRRPSVFERLGTKPAATINTSNSSDFCRNWALNGSCSYGKNCKYANTHTLISPSKRVKKDNATTNATTNATLLNEDPFKRFTSKIVKKTSHSPDLNLEEWNQTDLEYEDEKVLERRRQLLQRELEIQMKKDKEVHGKDKVKFKKKVMSSSSSSRSSSSSTSSSSSSSDDSSSTSTSDSHKKVKKLKKVKHHSVSPDHEDKEKKKKLKLKRLGQKNEKVVVKKKRKIEVTNKKEEKPAKKSNPVPVRKHSVPRTKSPAPLMSHPSGNRKSKERNRSESPKPKVKENDKDKHHKKIREEESVPKDLLKNKPTEKPKEFDKIKSRPSDEKNKVDDKSKRRSKEKERRSRTPPIDKSKHQHSKDNISIKSKRSRTPEKSSRTKHDHTPSRHQDKRSTSSRPRELDKKDRDSHKLDKSKDREDIRKLDQGKSKPSSSQDESHRKNPGRDFEDKSYPGDRSRPRSKERRDKDHIRDDHRDSRLNRDQRDQREKDRDEPQDRRDRPRDREREKDIPKVREREIPSLMAATAVNPMDKSSRYRKSKDRMKDCPVDKGNLRDRRNDRDKDRNDSKLVERDRSSQRFDARFDRPGDKDIPIHKIVDRERMDRFPKDRSMDRIGDKSVPTRDHLLDRDPIYERDRHRRFNPRFERGHPDHDRKDQQHIPPMKIDRLTDRRDSPRGNIEMDRNFDRNYSRLPPDHWNEEEEQGSHLDYRDHHPHEEDRRKGVEPRRYSPFNDRRGRDDRSQRYGMQGERQFDDIHHPVYPGDKIRSGGGIRDESSNDNWDVHHEVEHGVRDRPYQGNDWEEREWRGGRGLWDRESLPRSEAHEEDWTSRYDSPMADWKMNDTRKWDNQPMHLRGNYRNDRMKDMDVGEPNHGKRRSYNTPEVRDEIKPHTSKQGALHNSMKDEPINKKLMELAEGRPRKSREKSADSFQKKMPLKEKVELKEAPIPELKRVCHEEPLQTLHTESDLSDISDDPDDILNADDEIVDKGSKKNVETADQVASPTQNQDSSQPLAKQSVENTIISKDKDTAETIPYSNKNIEDESIETMDFEEISDGELEEDIKTSGKGLGDALGVDWASLVNESQPRCSIASNQDHTQNRWQCKAVFQRIGISVKTASHELVDEFVKKYGDTENVKLFLNDIALMHTALVRKHLLHNSSYGLLSSDVLLYSSKCKKHEENPEDLKPCTSLYDEAKMLLEQAT